MRQKGFVLLPVIIIILLVGFLGYFIYQNTQLQKGSGNLASPSTVPAVIVVPTTDLPKSSSTPNSTVNWKTYTNIKYNYQFQYPSTWLVQSMDSSEQLNQTSSVNLRAINDQTPAESGFSLTAISNPRNLSLTDWIKQNPNNGTLLLGAETINSTVNVINGLNWEKINNNSIGYVPTGNVKYGLTHDSNLYYVVIYSGDATTLDQILTTFKFTQ